MRVSNAGRGASERLLIAVFAIVVGSFFVATIVAQRMSSHLASLSHALTHDAMPEIEQIASLRDATLEVQLALADLVHGTADERRRELPILGARLARFRSEVRRGLAKGAELPHDVAGALHDFEAAVERTRDIVERDPGAARALFQTDLLLAANRLGDRAMQQIERNASHGRELALELQRTRSTVIRLTYGLVALSTIVATVGLLVLRRQNKRRLAAVGAYARDQESKARDQASKAQEMEQFAGRVAHDLRSPLSAASLASEMLEDEVGSTSGKTTVARLQRSLTRASALIDGLLAFARAGAHPEPGARADVREVIQDIADGLRPELQRSEIELELQAIPPVFVGCSSGVLASLLGNLVRNAAKYMGARQPRRISISVREDGGSVRIEVADTGPGIADEVVPKLFEPYFRALPTSTQPGLGLGLPTVRKLAEGHGGAVGVRSIVGKGSTFWFELPYAGGTWDASEHLAPPSVEVH